MFEKLHDTQRALFHFKTAVELDPTNEHALARLAHTYEHRQNPSEALRCYKALADLAPNNDSAHIRMGHLFCQIVPPEYSQAEHHYLQAIQLAPGVTVDSIFARRE